MSWDGVKRRVLRSLGSLVALIWVKGGVWLAAKAPRPHPGTPTVPDQITDEDRAWMAKAQQARMSQLENLRTAAKDWASTITAVTGALGIIALIKGPEEIGRLTDDWQAAVGIVLLIAVLLAIRGIVLAAVAAQGTPRSFSYSPAGYQGHVRREVQLAATQLRVSRIVVVLATLALIAAVGMTWYGEEKKKEGTRAYVVSTDGTSACGEITVATNGVILVQDGEAKPTRFEAEKIRALVPAGKCPD